MSTESVSSTSDSPKSRAAEIFRDIFAERSFGYATQFKLAIFILPITFTLMMLRLPVNLQEMPTAGRIIHTCILLTPLIIFLFLAWVAFRPAVIVNAAGLVFRELSLSTHQNKITWEQIIGLTVDFITPYRGKPVERIKIIYRSGNAEPGEILIVCGQYAQGDQLSTLLKQIIPQTKPEAMDQGLFQLHELPTGSLTYRSYVLNSQGIQLPSGVLGKGDGIPWEHITAIKTDPLVIAGYGATMIEYTRGSDGGMVRIPAEASDAYRECVNYLISCAHNATLDPALAKITAYPVKEAKADNVAVGLLICGIILSIAGLIILSFYPPTVVSTWTYPLLLIPFGLIPFVMALRLLLGRFAGGGATAYKKVVAATLFNAGVLASVAILFILSPASFTWLLADTFALIGNLGAAETLYKRCEPQLSGNEDFVFTLGQFYFKKGDWEMATHYYIRSYEKDPTNWMPIPLSRIPEALSRAGHHQEALGWCDTILTRYSTRKDVVTVIQKKKEEILAHAERTQEAIGGRR